MAGASVLFIAYGLVVILLVNLVRRWAWSEGVLLVASLLFLWLCASGDSLVPLACFVGAGFLGLKLIESGRLRTATPLVVVMILTFVWLKKYTFLPSALSLQNSYTTLGLSYILFRVIHVLEDAASHTLPGQVGLAPYLVYTLNFTTLIAGPIQRYQEFHKAQSEATRPSTLRIGIAVERIITGFFKANVMALAFSMLKTAAVNQITGSASNETLILAGAAVILSYPFFLYCNFSGYIDIVIGIALLIGIRLPENFDRPFSAHSFIDFWNRWHITLSTWLKTYVYNPLLMLLMRRFPSDSLAPVWGVCAFFVTFFLVGAWHGQTAAFLFFGVLQGLGVALNKLYEIVLTAKLGRKRVKVLTSDPWYVSVSRGLTFTWFAFTLLWFWSDWRQLSGFVAVMGMNAVLAALLVVLVTSTVGLRLWETARAVFLNMEWHGQAVMLSRYTRTAWCTVLVLFSVAAGLLFRQQVPEIVYKKF
jgi:alginate O-acetyltransferase complex protein AlgI